MQRLKKYIYGAATLIWMFRIYGFSAETGSVSGGKSMNIAAGIERVIHFITGGGLSYNKENLIFEISHIIRKSAHVAAFLILAVLMFLLIESIMGKKKIFYPILFTVLCAASDEFHQSLVPGRGPSINDVGIDSAGAIIGVMLIWLFLSRLRKDKMELR